MDHVSTLTPDELSTDLRMLSSSIACELYLASQKLVVYPSSHPTRQEAVISVFLLLKHWFKFKLFYQLQTDAENLWTEKIALEKSSFTGGMVSLLAKQNVKSLRFYDWLTKGELYFFLEELSRAHQSLVERLSQQGITSIEVGSSSSGKCQFYAGSLTGGDGIFTVKELAEDELRRNPSVAVKIILGRVKETKARTGFRKEVLFSVAEKVFASFSCDLICQLLKEELKISPCAHELDRLMLQIDRHPQCKALRFDLERALGATSLAGEACEFHFEGFGLGVFQELLEKISSGELALVSDEDFLFSMSAFLERGNYGKVRQILGDLTGQLVSHSISNRRRSLSLTKSAMDLLIDHQMLCSYLYRCLSDLWHSQKETFEILDGLSVFAEKLLVHRQYLDFVTILDFLKKKSKEETLAYNKGVLEKGLNRLMDGKVVNRLIGDMSEMDKGKAFEIVKCLESINTNEVAEKLSRMIDHPQSTKRVASLRVLAQMGEQGIGSISSFFDRQALIGDWSKRDLDGKGRTRVYEMIETLARSKNPKAIKLLEEISRVKDVEVKLKVISTLGSSDIPGGVSVVRILALDALPEVRKKAIDSLRGRVSCKDLEWLEPIYFDDHKNVKELIDVIVKLRSKKADDFLLRVLTQDKRLKKDLASQIQILEALSKREGEPAREEVRILKQRLNAKPTSSLRRLVLKRKVNQLIRQVARQEADKEDSGVIPI